MKYTLLLLAVILFCYKPSYSQTVDGIYLKDLEGDYLVIVRQAKPFSNKLSIGLDYGQEKTSLMYTYRNTIIKDANGNNVQFD